MTTPASQPAQKIVKIPRTLIVDIALTASGALQPYSLQVPSDMDFEWWWLAAFRTSNANGGVKVLIAETGVGNRNFIIAGSPQQTLAFQGILIDNLAGLVSSNAAFPIAVPYVMPASRIYQHQFTELSGAPNTVQLAYHGFGLLAVSADASSSQAS